MFEHGTFTMNGGTISYNNSPKGGGGVFITSYLKDSVMIINGGTISNNTSNIDGGGISSWVELGTSYSTIVYIKNGVIENNTAPWGPNFRTGNGGQIIDER